MKQTEVGLIPDDWEVKTLKQIFEFKPNNTFPRECLNESKGEYQNVHYGDVLIKYPSILDCNKEAIPFINEGIDVKFSKYGVKEGDIIIADTAEDETVGKVVEVYNLSKRKLVSGLHTFLCRKITDDFAPRWLGYFMNQAIFHNQLLPFITGTKVSAISRSAIQNVKVLIPPLPEQQQITKALSDVDALISTTEKLLQKKKNIKQGAMQELLTGKKRLPGFAKSTRTKMTELGEIPEAWEVKTLSEIFEFKPNNTFTRDCLNDSKGEYQNVHYGDVLIKYPNILDCSKESIPFINEGINIKFPKYGIMEGDIIIADTAEDETVGKVVEIFNLGEKKIVSGLHTFLCRKITDDFAPKWLGYFMNQAIFHNQLLPFITGTKVSAISRTAIQNVKVLIPSKEEQTAIANVLSSMDKEIETLNTKLEKYRNLKTAMMQQLLTGKIRLVK